MNVAMQAGAARAVASALVARCDSSDPIMPGDGGLLAKPKLCGCPRGYPRSAFALLPLAMVSAFSHSAVTS
jgi:hypothetical protein